MLRKNSRPGYCSEKSCSCYVPSWEGHLVWENGERKMYCSQHTPDAQSRAMIPRRDLTSDGKVLIYPLMADELKLIKSFPGAKYISAKPRSYWKVSTEIDDRDQVLNLARRLNLNISPELLTTTTPDEVLEACEKGLYPYQLEGINFLAHNKRCLLADDMGLGKGVQSLHALEFDDRVIVVCPASVQTHWAAEAHTWRPEFSVKVLRGRNSFELPKHGEIVITNYSILPKWLVPRMVRKTKVLEIPPEFAGIRHCVAIIDEIHNASNNKSVQSKKVFSLARAVNKTWSLTGTPLLNHPNQLYNVLEAGDLVKSTFQTFDNFRKAFNAKGTKRNTIWGEPSPQVPSILRNSMLRRLRNDVLPDLPEITYSTLILDEFNANLLALLDAHWDEYHSQIVTDKILPPFEDFSGIRREIAESRIPCMLEYVQESKNQEVPLVVFSAHRGPILALGELPDWGVITGSTPQKRRQEIVQSFQNGDLAGVGLTYRAGGVGINLTRAWKALLVDMDWTPAIVAQAVARILRIGQVSKKIEVTRMVSNHPLERHISDLLLHKIRLIIKSLDDVPVPV